MAKIFNFPTGEKNPNIKKGGIVPAGGATVLFPEFRKPEVIIRPELGDSVLALDEAATQKIYDMFCEQHKGRLARNLAKILAKLRRQGHIDPTFEYALTQINPNVNAWRVYEEHLKLDKAGKKNLYSVDIIFNDSYESLWGNDRVIKNVPITLLKKKIISPA